MSRLTLTIVLLVSVIPSFGMAGVIVDSIGPVQNISSASLDGDQTPAPISLLQLKTARNMFGMNANSVTTISSSTDAIGGCPVFFVKAVPPVESIHGFGEWLFVPDSPVLKISKVPIG